MNGPRIGFTVTWDVTYPGTGTTVEGAVIVWLNATAYPLPVGIGDLDVVAQTATVGVSGTYSDPISYAGDPWQVELRPDDDLPIGVGSTRLSVYINGALAVTGDVGNSLDPFLQMYAMRIRWSPFYHYAGGVYVANFDCSDFSLSRWDGDLADATWSAHTVGQEYWISQWFAIRGPMPCPPVRLVDGSRALYRLGHEGASDDVSDLNAHYQWWSRHGDGAWAQRAMIAYLGGPAAIYGTVALAGADRAKVIWWEQGKGSADFGDTWDSPDGLGGLAGYAATELRDDRLILTAWHGRASPFTEGISATIWAWDWDPPMGVVSPAEYGVTGAPVATDLRTGTPSGGRPWPLVGRRDDGVWVVAAFWDTQFVEWTADDLVGTTWTEAHSQAIAGTGADLVAPCWARGRGGEQVAVGYQPDDQQVVAHARTAWATDWTEVVLAVDVTLATAPYVVELEAGGWEIGWLTAGAWVRYRAEDPTGTWTVVA